MALPSAVSSSACWISDQRAMIGGEGEAVDGLHSLEATIEMNRFHGNHTCLVGITHDVVGVVDDPHVRGYIKRPHRFVICEFLVDHCLAKVLVAILDAKGDFVQTDFLKRLQAPVCDGLNTRLHPEGQLHILIHLAELSEL